MKFIPAIDLKDNKCVRLKKGKEENLTIFNDNPVNQAKFFEKSGCERIHLVDLDAAFGRPQINRDTIINIKRSIQIPVQLGGGLRTADDVERMLKLGVSSVIIGTMAVKNPDVFEDIIKHYSGEQIFLGIDARNRKVAIEGWQEGTEIYDVNFALHWKKIGIQRVVFTDIARDGMLSGPNIEALRNFARGTGLKIVASGGVSSMKDLELLKTLEADGVDQVISGKAIYEGKLDLKEIFKC